jgi:ERCC4-related helicase
MDECHHASGKHPYACIMTVSLRLYSLHVSILTVLCV